MRRILLLNTTVFKVGPGGPGSLSATPIAKLFFPKCAARPHCFSYGDVSDSWGLLCLLHVLVWVIDWPPVNFHPARARYPCVSNPFLSAPTLVSFVLLANWLSMVLPIPPTAVCQKI